MLKVVRKSLATSPTGAGRFPVKNTGSIAGGGQGGAGPSRAGGNAGGVALS